MTCSTPPWIDPGLWPNSPHPSNYPPALTDSVEFVIGKAQGLEATWLKILKIKGRREQPPTLESSSAERGQRANSRQRTSLLCPSGRGGMAQHLRQGSAPALWGWLSV